MALLVHNGFEFGNILAGGYNIQEDEADKISVQTMGDGSVRTNYGKMDKTYIKIKFGRMPKSLVREYLQHFQKHEDNYSYYSLKKNTLLTKKFSVSSPDLSMLLSTEDGWIDEWEIELSQVGGGSIL